MTHKQVELSNLPVKDIRGNGTLHGSLHPTLLRSFFDISTAKTWDGKLPLPRNQVSEAPTGALPSIEIATNREYKAETSPAAVVRLK